MYEQITGGLRERSYQSINEIRFPDHKEIARGTLRAIIREAELTVEEFRELLKWSSARVVEWYTRTFEGRMPQGVRVQIPPRAPSRVLPHFLDGEKGQ